MAITRVYLLARELGVSSTAIMKKCQDEGLDIKNHMATISAGLAATIKEWFSEGDHTTAIETAQKVDLEKARVRKSRGKKTAEAEPTTTEAPQETPVVAEIQESPPVLETPAEPTPIIDKPAPPQPRRAAASEKVDGAGRAIHSSADKWDARLKPAPCQNGSPEASTAVGLPRQRSTGAISNGTGQSRPRLSMSASSRWRSPPAATPHRETSERRSR